MEKIKNIIMEVEVSEENNGHDGSPLYEELLDEFENDVLTKIKEYQQYINSSAPIDAKLRLVANIDRYFGRNGSWQSSSCYAGYVHVLYYNTEDDYTEHAKKIKVVIYINANEEFTNEERRSIFTDLGDDNQLAYPNNPSIYASYNNELDEWKESVHDWDSELPTLNGI